MYLTKYRPMPTLGSLMESFDRDFFPVFRSWFDRDVESEEFRLPRTNIEESEKEYILTMEMPGVEKKNVDVSMEGNRLTVSGETTEKQKEESKGLIRREIRSEKFRRSFTLNGGIDRSKIKAKLENGMLTVTLPKKEESVGRKIDIE